MKNVEALTGGKSDPYVRVLNAGIVLARSLIVNNNLDPEWDEYDPFLVSSAGCANVVCRRHLQNYLCACS